jgi:hypothetical protein
MAGFKVITEGVNPDGFQMAISEPQRDLDHAGRATRSWSGICVVWAALSKGSTVLILANPLNR